MYSDGIEGKRVHVTRVYFVFPEMSIKSSRATAAALQITVDIFAEFCNIDFELVWLLLFEQTRGFSGFSWIHALFRLFFLFSMTF